MTKAEFDALYEYSTSLPSGTYLGKIWKRNSLVFQRPKESWLLGEYAPDPQAKIGKDGKPDTVLIVWRKIHVENADGTISDMSPVEP